MSVTPEIIAAAQHRLERIESILPEVESLLKKLQAGDLRIQTKTNDMDLVTRADLESEAIIKTLIEREFPEDCILAEESKQAEPLAIIAGAGDALVWAIDPVDGTINYAHGLPLYSVSIGLIYRGQPIAGIVSLPALGQRYRAVQGQGAFCDGQQLQVSATDEISRALLVTGFPYTRHRMMDTLFDGLRSVLTHMRGVRRTGSAAIDLCWLAHGRFDCYYEFNLNPWDTAAGTVLVREAGGKLSDYRGNEHQPGDYQLAASNGRLHEAFLKVLAPVADAERLPPE